MKRRSRIATLATALLILLVAGVPACGDKSTNPGGGIMKELNSGNIAGGGGVYAHTFATAGTYNYHCTIHGAGMAGSVTVAGGQGAAAAVAIGDNFYNPVNVSVAPGGTVTWTNNGTTHTVTSN